MDKVKDIFNKVKEFIKKIYLIVKDFIINKGIPFIKETVIKIKVFIKKDVRELGSGNAGTTNMMRVAGFLPGALTFICDALKGFVACYLGKLIFKTVFENGDEWAVYGAFLCGFACMIGHVFPIFFQSSHPCAWRHHPAK